MHPTWSAKQALKFVTVLWKRLDPDQKKHYKDLNEKDKQRFKLERQSWIAAQEAIKVKSNTEKDTIISEKVVT